MNFLLVPILLLTLLLLLFGTFFIVKQQSAAVIERFGKFVSTRHSGLQLKIPVIDRVAGRLSLRIQQLDVVIETKTKDDVFVKVKVSRSQNIPCHHFEFLIALVRIHLLGAIPFMLGWVAATWIWKTHKN